MNSNSGCHRVGFQVNVLSVKFTAGEIKENEKKPQVIHFTSTKIYLKFAQMLVRNSSIDDSRYSQKLAALHAFEMNNSFWWNVLAKKDETISANLPSERSLVYFSQPEKIRHRWDSF